MKPRVDIILPVYFEQENIEEVLQGIESSVKAPHTTHLVFQDKKDPTIHAADKLRVKNIQVHFTKNRIGLADAIREGVKHVTTDIIVIMMSDLSDNPHDIDKMVKKIDDGYDFVCGSRYMKRGKRSGGSKLKGILSQTSCLSLRIFTGIRTHDATNAFKCFRTDLIKKITIESEKGYETGLELLVKANALGMKIGEVPTVWHERKKGKSKFKLFSLMPHYMRWYVYSLTHAKGSLSRKTDL